MNPRTSAVVGVTLALLVIATSTLARHYHDARRHRAADAFERGRAAVADGRLGEGLSALRAALTLQRSNSEYSLVLAQALVAAGRPREALSYIEWPMRVDPTSGQINLVRGRIARALMDADAAVWFERAFVGSWPDTAPHARADAGLELARFLLAAGEADRARAVLLRVAAETTEPARVIEAAALLMNAHAPADAADVLRRMTRGVKQAAAWRLLAEAEFTAGQDEAAVAAAREALSLEPGDTRARHIVDVAGLARALDPTVPRLGGAERRRRARELVARALRAYDECVATLTRQAPEDDALGTAREAAAGRRAGADADDLIDVATFVWALRASTCGPVPPGHEALDRVMTRMESGSTAR